MKHMITYNYSKQIARAFALIVIAFPCGFRPLLAAEWAFADREPDTTRVLIVNGTGVEGTAREFAVWLQRKGFREVSAVPMSAAPTNSSEIHYRPSRWLEAEKILNWLPPSSQVQTLAWKSKFDVVAVLGRDAVAKRAVSFAQRTLPAPAAMERGAQILRPAEMCPAESKDLTAASGAFPSGPLSRPAQESPAAVTVTAVHPAADPAPAPPPEDALTPKVQKQEREIARLSQELTELRNRPLQNAFSTDADLPTLPNSFRPFRAGIHAAALTPFGKTGQAFGQTFGGQATLGYGISEPWKIELAAGGFYSAVRVTRKDNTTANGSLLLAPASLCILHDFGRARIRPFVGAGPALQFAKISNKAVLQPDLSGANSAVGFGYELRLGMRYALGRTSKLLAEVGWMGAEYEMAGAREGSGLRFSLGIGL
ncbi:MAG: LytR C-terminal domain-containing protein [Nitrospirae bacterium]|nr:LytR C-terminal domain-containing protein [Nitrospirota bacterium]